MKDNKIMPEISEFATLKEDAYAVAYYLSNGDPVASHYLARIIEADTQGAFQPFAQALAARLCDLLERWAELGETDPYVTLEDEVYGLFQTTAIDWDGLQHNGRPGEES